MGEFFLKACVVISFRTSAKGDSTPIISSLREKIKSYIQTVFTHDAKLEAEIRIAKAQRDDYRRKIDRVDLWTKNEKRVGTFFWFVYVSKNRQVLIT